MKDMGKKKNDYEKLDCNHLFMVLLMWPFPIDKYRWTQRDRTYRFTTCTLQMYLFTCSLQKYEIRNMLIKLTQDSNQMVYRVKTYTIAIHLLHPNTYPAKHLFFSLFSNVSGLGYLCLGTREHCILLFSVCILQITGHEKTAHEQVRNNKRLEKECVQLELVLELELAD